MHTVDDIEMLARSGGLKGPADAWTILRAAIENYAAQRVTVERLSARAEERERCAAICDAGMSGTSKAYADACYTCATQIRVDCGEAAHDEGRCGNGSCLRGA